MNADLHSDELPAVFGVLRELLSPAGTEEDTLAIELSRMEVELRQGDSDESYAFTPFILHLIKTRHLERCASTGLLEKLQDSARVAAAHSLSRDITMQKVAGALQEHDCEAILLKGAALDKYLYDREAFRQGVDIDLLVTESDFDRMEQILAGIANKEEVFPGRSAHSKEAAQASFVVDAPISVWLDIHYQYAQADIYRINCEDLFLRSAKHPAHDSILRLMAPEDNLVHFAIHGFKDKSLFQKQTVDAFLLINAEDIDWPTLVERAQNCAALMPLVYLVEGMRRVFGYEPPVEIRDSLRLKGARLFLVNQLLADKPTPGVRTGWKYRGRQLGVTWLLSGNLGGYLGHQLRYLRNRVSDRFDKQ